MKKILGFISLLVFLGVAPLLPATHVFAEDTTEVKIIKFDQTDQLETSVGGVIPDPKPVVDQPQSYLSKARVSLPSKFDPRGVLVTPVKDQNPYDLCWAFSSLGAIESAALKSTGTTYDFSELYTDYLYAQDANGIFGTNLKAYDRNLHENGYTASPLYGALNWDLPVLEEKLPYNSDGGYRDLSILNEKPVAHVQGTVEVARLYNDATLEVQMQKVQKIKETIYKYGALTTELSSQSFIPSKYMNNLTNAVNVPRNNVPGPIDHATLIVGWDDEYSKNNFNINNKPANNGAFIVKNSWGTNWGDNGYYYLSYEDYYLMYSTEYGVKQIEKTDNYNNNYTMTTNMVNNGVFFGSAFQSVYMANILNASTDVNEKVAAIAFDTMQYNTPYEIYINPNSSDKSLSSLQLVASGIKEDIGVETIKLNNPITITSKDKYAVVIRILKPTGNVNIVAPYVAKNNMCPNEIVNIGESFYYGQIDGDPVRWEEISDSTKNGFNLTANFFTNIYTIVNVNNISLNETAKTIDKGTSFQLSATISPSNATNQNVTWTSSDPSIATVDQTGKVTGVAVGTATITVTTADGNKIATCIVTVKASDRIIKDVFPDSILASEIARQLGKTVNDSFTSEDALKITTINVPKVGDASGIEYLINLKALLLTDGPLSEIDVSKNLNLDTLYLQWNQLTSIDLSKNTKLVNLQLQNNKLTSIDLSQNPNLAYAQINYNQLSEIDVSNNLKLTKFSVGGNKLTSIDVSKNISLKNLSVFENQLSSIDLSKNVNLEYLSVMKNQLTHLDLSQNLKLTQVYTANNQLSQLDVSKLTQLTYLEATSNQITSFDSSQNLKLTELYLGWNKVASINVSNSTLLTKLYLNDNLLTSINVSPLMELTYLQLVNNKLTTIDLSKNTKLVAYYYTGNPGVVVIPPAN